MADEFADPPVPSLWVAVGLFAGAGACALAGLWILRRIDRGF